MHELLGERADRPFFLTVGVALVHITPIGKRKDTSANSFVHVT